MCKTVFKNYLLRVASLTHIRGGSRISKDCPPMENQFCSKNSSKLHGIKNIYILGGRGAPAHVRGMQWWTVCSVKHKGQCNVAIRSCNHTPDNIKARVPTGTWNRYTQHFKMISAIKESGFYCIQKNLPFQPACALLLQVLDPPRLWVTESALSKSLIWPKPAALYIIINRKSIVNLTYYRLQVVTGR